MLVRRLADAPVEERHTLRTHILMDAGELGSRHLTVTWVEVPSGGHQELHSHEDSEQAYVVVSGAGRITVTGETQEVATGDLVFIPPATDHGIENDGPDDLVYVSATSPPVSMEELYEGQLASEVAGYDADQD